ncbi:MAG: P-loop ATPase, Sll1717 family [Rhizomicrobium sp.]
MANPVRFRKNANIGSADAEADRAYLESCYVDTGDVSVLLDCADSRCLVLGRTGIGKTALLQRVLKVAEHSVELAPEALALSYITNSTIFRFFEEAGVGLDVFYQLLWRHIIVVELLKLRFDINNEEKQRDFFSTFKIALTRSRAKERAFQYLRDLGDKFWKETEYRTKEFTHKLETDLQGSVKLDVGRIAMGAEGARKLSELERIEVRERGTHIVNSVQVKELHDVITFLEEDVFSDRQRPYFLVIDRLDESWVDDRIRFKLIKALLEAVHSFKKIEQAKIIIALRTDLHYRVLRETIRPGFQEEKYNSLYLPLRWGRSQLITLLDDRVSFLFQRQYTQDNVRLADILPAGKIDRTTDAVDYILERTFFRPREANRARSVARWFGTDRRDRLTPRCAPSCAS